jgi:alpha-beta hydrolase superfamily lysophospholipase
MKADQGRVRIITIIYLTLALYILTSYVVLPIILTSTVLGRIETLDRSYDPPSGTPHLPQTVIIPTNDNITLSGWLFPVDDPKAWLVILPDPHRNRSGMMSLVRWLTNNNYGVVAMDLRARGESEGKYLTGGLLEAHDLIATIRQIQPQLGEQVPVVAYGVSIGAVAALIAAAQTDAFDAVIADSPNLQTADWMYEEAKRRGWPQIPGLYTTSRLWAPIITGHSESGSNIDLASMVKSIRVPVLLLMGADDPALTKNDMAILRAAIPASTVPATFPNGYCNSLYTLNMESYQNAIKEFLTVISPPPSE